MVPWCTSLTKPQVYDASRFLRDHPGGPEVILEIAGQDATDVFEDAAHSSEARVMLLPLHVGGVEGIAPSVGQDKKPADVADQATGLSSSPSAQNRKSSRPLGFSFPTRDPVISSGGPGGSSLFFLASALPIAVVSVFALLPYTYTNTGAGTKTGAVITVPGIGSFSPRDYQLNIDIVWGSVIAVQFILFGIFGTLVSRFLYVDFGRLEKYPSVISMELMPHNLTTPIGVENPTNRHSSWMSQ